MDEFTAPYTSVLAGYTLSLNTGVNSARTARLYVDQNGNVGIGTGTTPASTKLEIAGNVSAQQSNGRYFGFGVGGFSFDGTTVNDYGITYTTISSTYNTVLAAFSNIKFATSQTERMRINASGNVGIGTSSPARLLDLEQVSTDYQMRIGDTGNYYDIGRNTGNGLLTFYGSQAVASGYVFSTVNGERMRIDTSGNVLFNTTDTTLYNNTSGYGVCYRVNSSFDVLSTSDNAVILNRTGTDGSIEEFRKSGTIVGSISVTGSATAYNTSSDYRLKNSVLPMTTGLATLAALNPVTYKWNADDSDGEGFIAHELAEVIPLAVTGAKDAVDADGNPVHQGVDYSKIVVHLVAAIQELKAELDQLKNNK
jgi:hypothetical protein